MTEQAGKKKTPPAPLAAEKIAAYLKQSPHFFDAHPEVLNEITVSHDAGAAVSLIEKQVQALKRENRKLKGTLQELVRVARANEQTLGRLSRLTVHLLGTETLDDLLGTLYASLAHDFEVDVAAVRRLAADAAQSETDADEDPATAAQLQKLFQELLERPRLRCGRLDPERARLLFGARGDGLASFAVVPLGDGGWQGMLCMGSRDAHRFPESSGVELLNHLGEILSALLGPRLPKQD